MLQIVYMKIFLILALEKKIYPRRDQLGEKLVLDLTNEEDDLDDAQSICSIFTTSSTDTADNLPGAGRIIDTYIYQALGRKLENWITHFTMKWVKPKDVTSFILQLWGEPRPCWDYHSIEFKGGNSSLAEYIKYGRRKGKVQEWLSSLVEEAYHAPNAFRRLMALIHVFHLASEDACMYAFLHETTVSRRLLKTLQSSLIPSGMNVLDIYTFWLVELGLEVTQETDNVQDGRSLARILTRRLQYVIRGYRERPGDMPPFLALIRILLLSTKAVCWLSQIESNTFPCKKDSILDILKVVFHLASAACCLLLLSHRYMEDETYKIDFHVNLHCSLINYCDTLMSRFISSLCLCAKKYSSPRFFKESLQILILLHGFQVSIILPNASSEAEVITSEFLFPSTEAYDFKKEQPRINRLWQNGVDRARRSTGSLAEVQLEIEETIQEFRKADLKRNIHLSNKAAEDKDKEASAQPCNQAQEFRDLSSDSESTLVASSSRASSVQDYRRESTIHDTKSTLPMDNVSFAVGFVAGLNLNISNQKNIFSDNLPSYRFSESLDEPADNKPKGEANREHIIDEVISICSLD